MIDRSKAH